MEYQLLFYGGLAGAVVTLAISILLFIKLNIKIVMEDLLGIRFSKLLSSKKKQEDDRQKAITNEIVLRKEAAGEVELEPTALLAEDSTELLKESVMEETTLLYEEAAATTILTAEAGETALLSDEQEETTLLTEETGPFFKKEVDIIVVHSEKIIS